MNLIKTYIFDNNKNDVEKSNIFWNMIGSFIYAIISMTLGMFVIKFSNLSIGGLIFFAFATVGQQIYIIASFGIRPIHITDVERRYSFKEYACVRLITSVISLVAAFIFMCFISYISTFNDFLIFLLMIIYKIIDAFCDLYECELQRLGCLYIAGKSMAIRSLVSSVLFIFTLWCSNNVMLASFIFVLSLLICMIFISRAGVCYITKKKYDKEIYTKKIWHVNKRHIINIVLLSFNLFVATFIDFLIFSLSKYAVQKNFQPDIYAIYSLLFLPTSVINLLAGFIIRPALTKLSCLHNERKNKDFRCESVKILVFIILLSVLCTFVAWLIGVYVIALLFDETKSYNFIMYRDVFAIIVAGGGLYAISNLIYYLLVIKNKERYILYSYIICLLFVFPFTEMFIVAHGIIGAGLIYFIAMLLLVALLACSYFVASIKEKNIYV